MEPITFLSQLPPFDQLEAEDLQLIQQGLQRLEVEEGAVILAQGGAPSTCLNVVRNGGVELRSHGQVLQVLEPGDLFGYPSLLAQEPPLADAVATEATVIYRVPETIFRKLLDRPPVAQHFLRGLGDRLRSAAGATQPLAERGLATPLRHLVARPPHFVAHDATVQQAAQAMIDANISSVLVAADPPGILTDRDLRRVVAEGLPPATPVVQRMTRPLRTLDSDTPVYAALLVMLEENIHHLALVEEGQVVGLVTSTDLLRHQSHSPLYVLRQMQDLEAPEVLSQYAPAVARVVATLLEDGTGAAQIGRIVSALNDALIHRLVHLAEQALGPAPTPFAWIVFGSEGRSEQMLLTDQDNALVFGEDSPAARTYFAALATRVVEGLLIAGFPPCPGGYMATNWCKPLAEWERTFADWIHRPEPQALMEIGIFFDFRPVYGSLSLESLDGMLAEAHRDGIFIAHLLRAAQEFAPPLGFFNRIRSDGGAIDIKHGGIAPIVGLARALALAAGSRERSTLERLAAAVRAGRLSAAGAEDLGEAFQYFLQLRLRRQLAALQVGATPDNRLLLKELSQREQRLLKDAFVSVRQLQEAIGSQYGG